MRLNAPRIHIVLLVALAAAIHITLAAAAGITAMAKYGDVLKYGGIEFTVRDVRVHRDLDGVEQYRSA